MNCLFCQTGKQGFEGSLTATDILNQIYSLPERDKLTNIVFMGQGEPMDNLDNVLRATEILTADYGYAWSPKRITVSSVGVKQAEEVYRGERMSRGNKPPLASPRAARHAHASRKGHAYRRCC